MSQLPNVSGQLPVSGDQHQGDSGVDGQQNVGQGYDSERYVLVEREKLKGVGGDINNAIHGAKQYHDYQQSGLGDLGEYLTSQNLSAWEIKRILENQGAEPVGDPPIQEPNAQPVNMDVNQIRAAAREEARAAAREEVQTYATKQSHESAMASETRYLNAAMDELGFKEGGPVNREWDVKPRIEARVRGTRALNISQQDPHREAKINAPYTHAEIQQATNDLKPLLAAQAQSTLEQQADNQADLNLPGASLTGSGSGGRQNKPLAEQSRDERKRQAELNYQKKHGHAPL